MDIRDTEDRLGGDGGNLVNKIKEQSKQIEVQIDSKQTKLKSLKNDIVSLQN